MYAYSSKNIKAQGEELREDDGGSSSSGRRKTIFDELTERRIQERIAKSAKEEQEQRRKIEEEAKERYLHDRNIIRSIPAFSSSVSPEQDKPLIYYYNPFPPPGQSLGVPSWHPAFQWLLEAYPELRNLKVPSAGVSYILRQCSLLERYEQRCKIIDEIILKMKIASEWEHNPASDAKVQSDYLRNVVCAGLLDQLNPPITDSEAERIDKEVDEYVKHYTDELKRRQERERNHAEDCWCITCQQKRHKELQQAVNNREHGVQ